MKFLQPGTRNYGLIIIAYLQNWILLTLANVQPVCNTPECHTLAQIYSKNMNPNGYPCSNFYDYVCHGWPAQYPRPSDKGVWNTHQLMVTKTLQDIKKLLEDPQPSHERAYEYVKTLYRACTKLPSLGRVNPIDIKAIMSRTGNWPMFPSNTQTWEHSHWQSIENQYINIAGDPTFFQYHLTDTGENGFYIKLVLQRTNSSYGVLNRLAPWTDQREKEQYKNFLFQVIHSVAPYDPQNNIHAIDRDLEDVLNFREELRNIIVNTYTDVDVTTIDRLQTWYDAKVPQQITSQINWLGLIRSMYIRSQDSYGDTVGPASSVIIQPQYILNLGALLSRTPARVIENHIHVYFAERHVQLTYDMEVSLFKSFNYGVTGNLRLEPERWQVCLQGENTATNLRKMYVDHYYPPPVGVAVSTLVEDTRQLVIQQILESTWPDNLMKQKWINRIQNVRGQQGYPAWYFDRFKTVPKHTYDIDPIEPNIHYLRDINRISVSASQLQLPFYNINVPYVVRYGCTASVMGHEFYHALDYKALMLDIHGSNSPGTQYMSQELEKRTQCFKSQYEYYRNEDIRNRGLQPGPTLTDTTSEDIPDVMGLKIGYAMYKQELFKNNGQCTVLPGFEHISCDQLFFIAYANAFCTAQDPRVDSQLLSSDVHSLSATRVNVAVSNMREFANAFGCQPGNPLVRQDTCDLWK